VDGVQKWSPASGRVYQEPTATAPKVKGLESKESTPLPDSLAHKGTANSQKPASKTALDSRLAEESLAIHLRYGGEYMDENPITGHPGSFHLSSTGRKDKLSVPLGGKQGTLSLKDTPLPTLNTKAAAENPLARNGKETKSPKTPNMPKPKRRKSKVGTTTPS
jgi:mediator of RNA polymerase II transcription subunit 6